MENTTGMPRISKPAIRGKMGIWIYYVSTFTFEEISERVVKDVAEEINESDLLRDMMQRSITNNYKNIMQYLLIEQERFFNAIILAVYDGAPTWREVCIDDGSGVGNYNMGLLTLQDEKIFPVDGQHRVWGIKGAIEKNPELKKEEVPVILIAHSNKPEGKRRTRRLFSTLNRYAKPVSMRDIIALDEDDAAAIVSRDIITYSDLFANVGIIDTHSKSVPENNDDDITSIITFYECNKELLWLLIKNKNVLDIEGKSVKNTKKKITEFIKRRPSDEFIKEYTEICTNYWKAILANCKIEKKAQRRRQDGGHLFYRPVALLPFTKVVTRIRDKTNMDFKDIISRFPNDVLWVRHNVWKWIIWEEIDGKKRMLNGNGAIIEKILLYIYEKQLSSDEQQTLCLLEPKEKQSMYKELKAKWKIEDYDNPWSVLEDILK